jgi:hypothetical protein
MNIMSSAANYTIQAPRVSKRRTKESGSFRTPSNFKREPPGRQVTPFRQPPSRSCSRPPGKRQATPPNWPDKPNKRLDKAKTALVGALTELGMIHATGVDR